MSRKGPQNKEYKKLLNLSTKILNVNPADKKIKNKIIIEDSYANKKHLKKKEKRKLNILLKKFLPLM